MKYNLFNFLNCYTINSIIKDLNNQISYVIENGATPDNPKLIFLEEKIRGLIIFYLKKYNFSYEYLDVIIKYIKKNDLPEFTKYNKESLKRYIKE